MLDNSLRGADIDESTLSNIGGGGPLGATAVIPLDQGPLPESRNFTTAGGTLIMWVSGSGFRGAGSTKSGFIGMDVLIDGAFTSFTGVFANERNSHRAFIGDAIVIPDLPAGPHVLKLEAARDPECNTASETIFSECTNTDPGDLFKVSILEIPD